MKFTTGKPNNSRNENLETFFFIGPKGTIFRGDSTFIWDTQVRTQLFQEIYVIEYYFCVLHEGGQPCRAGQTHRPSSPQIKWIENKLTGHTPRCVKKHFILLQVKLISVSSSYSSEMQRFNFNLIQVCI